MGIGTVQRMGERYKANGRAGFVINVQDVDDLMALASQVGPLRKCIRKLAHQMLMAWYGNDREMLRNLIRQLQEMGEDDNANV